MIGDITVADEIYIVCGYTDMRKSIDGLCAIVEDKLHMDPRVNAIFLFCGKRCDRIKIATEMRYETLPGVSLIGLCQASISRSLRRL